MFKLLYYGLVTLLFPFVLAIWMCNAMAAHDEKVRASKGD